MGRSKVAANRFFLVPLATFAENRSACGANEQTDQQLLPLLKISKSRQKCVVFAIKLLCRGSRAKIDFIYRNSQ